MSANPPHGLWRTICLTVFPWLAHVRVGAAKGLSFKTVTSRLHLEGDAGDPAVARKSDDAGGWAFYPGLPGMGVWVDPPSVWRTVSAPGVRPQVWAKVATCLTTGPLGTDEGTRAAITTGSAKVTCA